MSDALKAESKHAKFPGVVWAILSTAARASLHCERRLVSLDISSVYNSRITNAS